MIKWQTQRFSHQVWQSNTVSIVKNHWSPELKIYKKNEKKIIAGLLIERGQGKQRIYLRLF